MPSFPACQVTAEVVTAEVGDRFPRHAGTQAGSHGSKPVRTAPSPIWDSAGMLQGACYYQLSFSAEDGILIVASGGKAVSFAAGVNQ